jgi:hypothetical protein
VVQLLRARVAGSSHDKVSKHVSGNNGVVEEFSARTTSLRSINKRVDLGREALTLKT